MAWYVVPGGSSACSASVTPPSERNTNAIESPVVSRLSASTNAPAKSAAPAVVSMGSSAWAKASRSPLAVSTTRGRASATTMLATPPAGISLRRRRASALAALSRSGAPSRAAIEPDASRM